MLGTDHIYFPELMSHLTQSNAQVYPPEYINAIKPYENWNSIAPEQIIKITELLYQRGYGEEAIKNILGGNYLRIVKQVWK